MTYYVWPVILIVASVLGMLVGAGIARRAMKRADAHFQRQAWDEHVASTTGMYWNPITRHYEHPPGTVPFDPRGYGKGRR